MRSLTISEGSSSKAPMLSPSENVGSTLPVKRPDRGDSSAQQLRLRANFFAVSYKADVIIRHYDLDIKPAAEATNGRPVKLTKYALSLIRNKLSSTYSKDIPLSLTAYDGEKNIFSAEELPTGCFNVSFSKEEGLKVTSFVCKLTLVNELKLSKLNDYLRGISSSVPRDILQGLDVILKENPTRSMIRMGRRFYSRNSGDGWSDDLRQGVVASRGFQHTLKPTSDGLALCLDYSIMTFRKPIPVIKYLEERIHGFSMNNFNKFRRDVECELNKLKVTFTHRETKQNYTVAGLTQKSTGQISFTLQDVETNLSREVNLVAYYKQRYGADTRYPNVPCLELGKTQQTLVPIEFCALVEGQRFKKENLDTNTQRHLKNLSLVPPKQREEMICKMVNNTDGPLGGQVAQSFGINVSRNMTRVTGRVLIPPTLKLRSGPGGREMLVSVDKQRCWWNLTRNAVVDGKAIQRWAVLDFSSSERGWKRFDANQIIPNLIKRCASLGIHMEEPLRYESSNTHKLANINAIRELLDRINGGARLQILVCVMPEQHDGYDYLKWYSETKLGLMTQCCLSSKVNDKRGQDQYLANLVLKINAKLGGSNFELGNRLPKFGGEEHVMFIGADVNHAGSYTTDIPSIAAVVGTMNWPAVNRYAARVWPQDNRKEQILKFGEKCLELVEAYVQQNKVKPKKIVVFRDGVSEGQFEMVLNEELMDLRRAFRAMNYSPTITLIVAQKRHSARLFLDGGTGNVPPGTVVDTGITHQTYFDCYLSSHHGMIGTSKPAHYHVLWDEHRFSSNELQQFVYNLCFTFARCTKSVSLVPPVYYADLVAYRGQHYFKALSKAHTQASTAAWMDEQHYKLHPNVENSMFFI